VNRFLKERLQFVLLALSWVIVGIYMGPVIYAYLPLCIILFKRKGMYFELFFGFLLLLVLCDSRHPEMRWTVNLKEAYILFLAAFLFFDNKNFGKFEGFYIRFVPFILVALYCSIDAMFPSKAFQKAISYLLLLVVAPNYVMKLYRDEGDNLLKSLVWLGTALLAIGILLYFVKPQLVNFFGRYCGVLGNPNGLGIYTMLIFLLFSTVMSVRPKLFDQNEKLFIYVVVLLTLFMSGSRSSIIAVIIFSLFNYFNRMSPALGIIVFLFIIVSYQIIENNLKSIIIAFGLDSYFRLNTLETGSGRVVAWAFAWKEIQNNFFIGRGFSYTDYVFEWNYIALNNKGHNGNAHNSYLTLWLDTGLVGLTFYLIALLSTFIKAAMMSRVAIGIMYALLFQIFFESWLAASLNPYTILLVIILVILSSPEIVEKPAEVTVEKPEEEEVFPDFYPQRFVPR
jgi:O-antigen ligase